MRPPQPAESATIGRTLLRRWVGPALLVALAPKCVLCLLGYVGFAASLGLAGPELCGAAGDARSFSWLGWTITLGTALGLIRRRWRTTRANSARQPIHE